MPRIPKIEILIRCLEFGKAFWSKGNDVALGIKTMPHSFRVTKLAVENLHELNDHSVTSINVDSSGYESPDYANLRKIISFLNPQPHDVVFDLGSGMGRVLCLFAKRRVKRCVGIELFPSLCEVAEANAERLKGRMCPIEIRQGDVAQADFTEGTIFFLFNPFGADTLRCVIERINDSKRQSPREITFVYYKDLHAGVFESFSSLKKHHEMKTFSGINVSFWRNQLLDT